MYRVFFAALVIIISACSSDDDPVDCEKSGPIINLEQIFNASNCSTNDGGIEVAVSGGKEPYSFWVNDQLVDGSGQISNLTAGSYSVMVKDANSCMSSVDNIQISAADFSFTTTMVPNTSCLSGNGQVTIDISSTNPPYSFKLANGDFNSENSFSGLASGNHMITVRDNNNCMITLSVTVPQGITGTSWSNDILPIMKTSCAISGCHNGVSRSNNFSEYTSVKSFAKNIKSKTADRSMPFDGTPLTQNQIDLIACWVDDGALQN